MQSPENTNPAVLEGMLNELDGSESSSGGIEFITIDFNIITTYSINCNVCNTFTIIDEEDKDFDYKLQSFWEVSFDNSHQTAQLKVPFISSNNVVNELEFDIPLGYTGASFSGSDGVIYDEIDSSAVYYIITGPGTVSGTITSGGSPK